MSIWIDPPLWPRHGTTFSHLVSDVSLTELHAFAARVGLHPRSFEGDHYDVPLHRYDDAVAAGATPTTGADLVRRLLASGLRLRKRRGDLPVARVAGVPAPGGGVMDVDLVASGSALDRGRLVAVAVLVDDGKGRLAAVRTPARDAWGPPGGGVDPGETGGAAAVREVAEETGLVLDPLDLRPVGWERFTVRPDAGGEGGRWGPGASYLQLYAATTRPRPLVPVGPDVDAAAWLDGPRLRERCGTQFWWPLLEHLAPVVGLSAG